MIHTLPQAEPPSSANDPVPVTCGGGEALPRCRSPPDVSDEYASELFMKFKNSSPALRCQVPRAPPNPARFETSILRLPGPVLACEGRGSSWPSAQVAVAGNLPAGRTNKPEAVRRLQRLPLCPWRCTLASFSRDPRKRQGRRRPARGCRSGAIGRRDSLSEDRRPATK